ncbi:hypothetical protein [Streptacidiphilus sp. MAP12-16]|uniref:hypothetical protein n=1 Tax=Streptacidiphilus sp. MAP12-16 TaxID=3156300 RepID=UPI0035113212
MFTAALLLGLLAMFGLVIDGGLALAARVQAYGQAQEAARAGARQLDQAALRGQGPVVIDPPAACRAATDFLTGSGSTGEVTATTTSVTVTVHRAQHTQFLTLLGITAIHVTGTATAHPQISTTP